MLWNTLFLNLPPSQCSFRHEYCDLWHDYCLIKPMGFFHPCYHPMVEPPILDTFGWGLNLLLPQRSDEVCFFLMWVTEWAQLRIHEADTHYSAWLGVIGTGVTDWMELLWNRFLLVNPFLTWRYERVVTGHALYIRYFIGQILPSHQSTYVRVRLTNEIPYVKCMTGHNPFVTFRLRTD